MSSIAKKMVSGSILRTVEFVAGALVGLVMMPFIIHSLGDKMYGLWIFVGSFLGYYSLMDFGISLAVQRYCAKSIALKDYEDANSTINSAFAVFIGIGLLVLLVSCGISILVPMVMHNIVEKAMFSKVVFILGMNFAFGLPLRVFAGVLNANFRYDINAGIEIIKLCIRTFLIIIFLKNGYGVIALALITCVVDLTAYLFKYFIARRLYSYIKLNVFKFDKSKVRSLLNYSYVRFIIEITNQLKFNVDNIVIVACIGMNEVTMYSIGARLVRYYTDFIGSSISITTPLFSMYEAIGDQGAIQTAYIFLTKISSYLSILIGSILILFGKVFILRWMGNGFEQANTVLLILIVPSIFLNAQFPSINLLYGVSKHKYYAITNCVEGVLNVVLSVALSRKFGIYGVALGTAIPMLITNIFIQPIYVCKIIKLPFHKYYVNLMVPVIILSVSTVYIFWFFVQNLLTADYFAISCWATVESILFIAVVWFFGFNTVEKGYLKSVIRARVPKRA
jgi:O-antigen/teichoic acid export membrane protein